MPKAKIYNTLYRKSYKQQKRNARGNRASLGVIINLFGYLEDVDDGFY